MKDRKNFLGHLALWGTAFIWGTSFVILKEALDSIGTMWVLALRFIIAAALLLLAAGKRLKTLGRDGLRGGVLLGVCLAAAYIFQPYGLKYTTPGKNAFLTATYCVLVPFMVWAFFKRRPNAANIIAAFMCVFGIGLVSLSGTSPFNVGDALTLVCGIFYALQIILTERFIGDCDALSLTGVEFGTAAVICLAGALIFESAPVGLSLELWGSIAYMGVMCTALCFFLQTWGMRYTPSSTAAVIMTFESVFAIIISVIFYDEPVTVRLICGFTLIIASVIISERAPLRLKKIS